MSELHTIESLDRQPFKYMVATIGNLPTSFVDSMSYYELLAWLCQYLEKTVIPAINNNAEAVEELQAKYVELKAYVDKYFDNLDVQEEINNKLDDMAESGQLAEIIAAYVQLKAELVYHSVAEMKTATNLIDGSLARTSGYYTDGDGGGAYYLVREVLNTDDPNDMDTIALADENLVAVILPENTEIVVNQFGAYGDGIHDDTDAIQYAIDYGTPKKYTVKFLNKKYITTSPLVLREGTKLVGHEVNDEYGYNTLIQNATSNMVSLATSTIGIHIKNICFQGVRSNANIHFNNENTGSTAFEWCVFEHVGFRDYTKVFNDIYMLGCRLNDIWINHITTVGTMHGSDNTFTDWFVSGNYSSESSDLLTLDGFSLSRLTNIYFTGKTASNNGCRHILKLGSYTNNLSFNGCYFDFSNGGAISAVGGGNDFPRSGSSNISFNNCLFRGNCCSNDNVYHVINTEYVQNFNINNCSFNTQTLYTVNPSAKIYNFKQYTLGVSVANNQYENPYSITDTSITTNVQFNEPYIALYSKFSVQNDASRTKIYNDAVRNRYKLIDIPTFEGTTDGTYGALTVNFGRAFHTTPRVFAQVNGSTYYACINTISTTSVQLIIRNSSNGNPVVNTAVSGALIIVNPNEYDD